MSDKQEQRAESALGAVMLRNAFYRDSYKKALISLIAVILLDIILVAGELYFNMKNIITITIDIQSRH